MHHLQQSSSTGLLPLLAMLLSLSAGQAALAASEGSTPRAKAAATTLSGAQVYNAVCIACHYPPGLGGAPALGNGDEWTARLERGMDTLVQNALQGFSGQTGIMPRKGGRTDLSDEEISSAVHYMVEQSVQ